MTPKSSRRNVQFLVFSISLLTPGQLTSVFAQSEDSPTSTLPFELYQGHMILAQISMTGSQDSLSAMIDTGASRSIINRKAAKRMKATAFGGPAVKAQAFDGSSAVERVIVRGLRFAGRTLASRFRSEHARCSP
jgi:hypothetical protein